ncbi:plasmid replication protein RepC [Rhizobium terrae]|uniref:plasmid replication protein RepC n=1 Tax=Rhizobium terrae TaxID=2171756 RepID=UPI000E3C2BC1|nr:plasmid replication protein RepC [Rhizobium terrae]
MEYVSTPFGRRPMTLSLVKSQIDAANVPQARTIDKWQVLRDVCDARTRLKLRDRALAVLSALLSFHPETHLSSTDNLIVFPSNAQLSARANGIAGTTLRENLAILVQAGIVLRHDSPNGKRYARKSSSGRIQAAYGFSLSPLVARAAEFAALAQDIAAERRHLAILRERITLLRRDIRKLISIAQEEAGGNRGGELSALEMQYVALAGGISRVRSIAELTLSERILANLKKEILNHLALHWKSQNADGNADEIRCHIQNQNTESLTESELVCEKDPGGNGRAIGSTAISGIQSVAASRRGVSELVGVTSAPKALPLGMVIRSCPEIAAYGPKGRIDTWRELMSTAVVVRSMLGISPDLYQEACEAMGPEHAAATIACLLERADTINSPGAYLRTLTRKASCGQFSLVSMLMALAKGARPNHIARGKLS